MMIGEHEAAASEEPLSAKEREAERILDWRISQLSRAGYGGEAILLLAPSPDVDLTLAVELVRRGCPHDTALRILL
jgi:hypothetical protein